MNKWVGMTSLAGGPVGDPPALWQDPDRAVLDHMREILGTSLFDGCGQPDCFDCAED